MARKNKPKRKPTLRDRQRAFVDYYLECWNATEAARRAGYSEKTARQIAANLLSKVYIRDLIEQRLAELTMSANEVLYRLTEHARGDLAEFAGLTVEELKAHPKSWLLKEVEVTSVKIGEGTEERRVKLKIHDPQAALNLLGKHHMLFADRLQIDDWHSQAVADIKAGRITPDMAPEVERAFGRATAEQLFAEAGIVAVFAE